MLINELDRIVDAVVNDKYLFVGVLTTLFVIILVLIPEIWIVGVVKYS